MNEIESTSACITRTETLPAFNPSRSVDSITPARTVLFAASVGVIVLPLCAPQPLVTVIGPALGLPAQAASLIATMTLLGYGAGQILLVPLADLVENRRLIAATLSAVVAALLVSALAGSPAIFLGAAFVTGAATSAIQMLVPMAAMLAPPAQRGRVIGNVMSGLMIGILLSRPLASLVATALGWRSVYALDAALIALIAVLLCVTLPRRVPQKGPDYKALVASLWTLLTQERMLRQRALFQGLCMVAFSLFWTAIAFRLTAAPYSLDGNGVALFTLAGAAGAVISPIAGRMGDRGWTKPATALAHGAVLAAMLLAGVAGSGIAGSGLAGFDPAAHPSLSLALLVIAALLLDLGVIADQTLGRREINLLRPEARGRLNGLYTGLFFVGGSAGAALAAPIWAGYGWWPLCAAGAAFGAAALLCSLASLRGASTTERL